MPIPREFIEELKDANPIVEVAADYLDVTRVGNLYKAHCIHGTDSDMSLTLYPDTNSFHCFGCGAGSRDTTKNSDVISFVQWIEDLSYPEAVQKLAARANMKVPITETKEDVEKRNLLRSLTRQVEEYHASLKMEPKYMEYLNERGIDNVLIDRWMLGYKEGKIVYPITNPAGEICSFAVRKDPYDYASTDMKYQNMCNSAVFTKSRALYGMYFALRMLKEKNYFVIVEGYNDVICLQKFNIPAVSLMSNNITDGQVELMKRYTENILLFLDGDARGIEGMHKVARKLINAGFSVKVLIGPQEDPDEIANRMGNGIHKWMNDQSEFYGQYYMNEVLKRYQSVVTSAKVAASTKLDKLFEVIKFSPAEKMIYQKQMEDILLDRK